MSTNQTVMNSFNLKFNESEIAQIASRYNYETDIILDPIINSVKHDRYLEYNDFLNICEWKTKRSKSRCALNDKIMVEECTRIALNTPVEKLRIEILTLLSGVSWPTASTILHFCHEDKYPILDFRALWSLRITSVPTYNFSFWMEYTEFCRKLSARTQLDMRTIDRALWQYSKENQRA